ncbi:MAG: hypothetical protein IT377_20465 [Polyangiaceae bacterium]|nr:hypothetical protein [Polyangiaceae bacterium]
MLGRLLAGSLAAALASGFALAPSGAQPSGPARTSSRCGPDMVDIGGQFCIDRFETSLADRTSGRRMSPYYHPSPALAARDRRQWERLARDSGPLAARAVPLPELPAWQLEPGVVPIARSEAGRVPSAYLDLESARLACENAGKKLCQKRQWLMACRSQHATRHPYGEAFDPARCNLAAPLHPAVVLHGKQRLDGRDPRLNLVEHAGRALLRPTGTLLGCASPWEGDAVWDMEGNLDEWIDDPAGTFVGGFYARDTRWGCDARVEIHSADYYDYSLGARCCRV